MKIKYQKFPRGIYLQNPSLIGVKHQDQFDILKELFILQNITFERRYNTADANLDGINCDFVVFFDKDIHLAKSLENKGLALFNNSSSIELCDDKAATYLAVQEVPNVRLIPSIVSPYYYYPERQRDFEFLDLAELRFGYPFILKSTIGSLGERVFLISNRAEYSEILSNHPFSQVIAQKFIGTSFGRDLRIWVVNHKIVKTVVRRSEGCGEFRSSITLGGHYEEFRPLTDLEILTVQQISRALKLDFGTLDFLFGENEQLLFCEANTNAVFSNLDRNIGQAIVNHITKVIYDKTK